MGVGGWFSSDPTNVTKHVLLVTLVCMGLRWILDVIVASVSAFGWVVGWLVGWLFDGCWLFIVDWWAVVGQSP